MMKMLYYLFELMKIAVDAIAMMNYLHTGGFCDYYWVMMRRCGNVAMTHSYYYLFGMTENKREMMTMSKQRMEGILACLLWI